MQKKHVRDVASISTINKTMAESNSSRATDRARETLGLYLGDYSYLSGPWQHWVPVLRVLKELKLR